MKNVLWFLVFAQALLLSGCVDEGDAEKLGMLEGEAIFGEDDRTEYYLADPAMQAIARESVVALMLAQSLDVTDPSDVQIVAMELGWAYGLCAGERFFDQPTAAFCSGTLIDDDLVLTAGHCVETFTDCHSTAFVFDYYYEADGRLASITSQDIYHCKELLVQEFSTTVTGSVTEGQDYAIIQLDRPVGAPHTPRPVNLSHAPLALGESVTVIGFPTGLPAKVETAGVVLDPQPIQLQRFTHNTDSFGGNSGSGTLDSSFEVAGILVLGVNDYEQSSQGCVIPSVYPNRPEGYGMESNYVYTPIDALCALGWPSARLCGVAAACGDGFCSGTETSATCPADCTPASCGDQTCTPSEWGTCPLDCGWMKPPAGWGCDPRNYGRLDGCDCGCGLVDPDCSDSSAAVFGCQAGQTCSDGVCSGASQPPAGWTCGTWKYASRDGCDCECGAFDPDCSDTFAYNNCPDYYVCNLDNRCADILAAEGWTCNLFYFDAGDGCDCNCGIQDPDCLDPSAQVFNCQDGQICDDSGRCRSQGSIPATWQCPAEKYSDGLVCDCQCGAIDPDCAVPNTAQTCGVEFVCVDDQCVPTGVPASWTCDSSFYDTLDGCDCECGAPDPDCNRVDQAVFNCENPEMACVEGHCVGNWFCDAGRYGDGICDCDCGVLDTDCFTDEQRAAACPPGYVCNDWGSCEFGPPSQWTCDPNYYATGGCDCKCGIWDPDCDMEPRFARGCPAAGICVKPGVCTGGLVVPNTWTCGAGLYEDGQTCDCHCGAPDPDCLDGTLSVIGCDEEGASCVEDNCVSANYPPSGWTCDPWTFDANDGCHCGCGTVADTDCSDPSQPVLGCSSGQCRAGQCVDVVVPEEESVVAAGDGVCSTLPRRAPTGPFAAFVLLAFLAVLRRAERSAL